MEDLPPSLELDLLPDRVRGMLFISAVPHAGKWWLASTAAGICCIRFAFLNEGSALMLVGYAGAFVFLGIMALTFRQLFRLPKCVEFAKHHIEIGVDRWLRSQVLSAHATQPQAKKPIVLTLVAQDGTHEWLLDPFQHSLADAQWVAERLAAPSLELP